MIVTLLMGLEAVMLLKVPVLIAISALVSGAAWAQSSGASAVTISPKDCQRVIQHTPNADVAYKPGVDARGNPVTPADLPGSARITAPNEITINLTVDLLKEYGVASGSPLSPRGEASVGTVVYDIAAGRLTFNGEPLTDPELKMLGAGCSSVAIKKR